MAVGPYPGNGFVWSRGPYTLGIWVEPDHGGFGDAAVLGHKDGAAWAIDATLMQGDAGSWQYLINNQASGLIGKYYVEQILVRANFHIPTLYPVNAHPQPVQNTEPYAIDTMNALISQFTKPTAEGLLQQGP